MKTIFCLLCLFLISAAPVSGTAQRASRRPASNSGGLPKRAAARPEPRVTLTLNKVPFSEALAQLCAQARVPYRVDIPDLSQPVSVAIQSQPFSQALSMLLKEATPKLTSWQEDETLVIGETGQPRRRPEMVLQAGHSLHPFAMAFSANGRYAASAGFDRTIHLWDVLTGQEVRALTGNGMNVLTDVAFSPDGKQIAASDWGYMVYLWDVDSGRHLEPLKGHTRWATGVAYSPDGKRLLGGGADKKAFVWDVATGKIVLDLPHNTLVRAVAWSRDGGTLVTAEGSVIPGMDEDTIGEIWRKEKQPKTFLIRLWDAESGTLRKTLPGHDSGIRCLTLSHDGNRIASGDESGGIKVWDIATGKEIYSQKRDYVVGLAFTPDDAGLITLGSKDPLCRINLKSGKTTDLATTDQTEGTNCLAVSPNGRLAITNHDRQIQLWDMENRHEIRVSESQAAVIRYLAISPDGKLLVTASDDHLRWWNLITGKPLQSFAVNGDKVSFSPDQRYLYCQTSYHLQVRDARTGQRLYTFYMGGNGNFQPSPNGHLVFTSSTELGVTAWDPSSGKIVWRQARVPENNEDVAKNDNDIKVTTKSKFDKFYFEKFSASLPGAKTLQVNAFWGTKNGSSRHDERTVVLDMATGRVLNIKKYDNDGNWEQSYSANGARKAIGRMGSKETQFDFIEVRQKATGRKLYSQRYEQPGTEAFVEAMALRPDGKRLVVAYNIADASTPGGFLPTKERRLTIIDVDRKEVLKDLELPNSINAMAFTPDGRFLVTVGFEKSVRFWAADRLGEEASERLTLYPLGENDYLWTTPYGTYMASKQSLKKLSFRANERMFPFESFDLLFNRPDIILKTLGYAPPKKIEEYTRLHKDRLRRLHIQPESLQLEYTLPTVTLNETELRPSTSEANFTFTAKVQDTLTILDRLDVTVNGVPAFGRDGISLRTQKTKQASVPVTLSLSQGRNLISVSAMNDRGVESLHETFEVVRTDAAVKPRLFVVGIGVSTYADRRFQKLNYAAKDASDFVGFFHNANLPRFSEVKTLLLPENQVTRVGVQEKVGDFLKQTTPDDTVFLLLSGHGTLSDDLIYYYCTQDMVYGKPAQKGLSYADIEDLLYKAHARKKLLMMDTCHSGEVEDAPASKSAKAGVAAKAVAQVTGETLRGGGMTTWQRSESLDLLQEMFADLRRTSGAAIISASGGYQSARERTDLKNGAFTSALMEALRDPSLADEDNDGTIRVTELRSYVIRRVLEITDKQQKPTSRAENLELDFDILP